MGKQATSINFKTVEAAKPLTAQGVAALNMQFGKENLPDWIMLIPAGEKVEGRDGRFFTNPAPATVITRTLNNGMDIPVDIDHAIVTKDEAPAQGWIKEFELREGAIWGRVEWTHSGAWQVSDKFYRYISPVFEYIPLSDNPSNPDYHNGEIQLITSVALTNRPNLKMPALNHKNTIPLSNNTNGVLKMDQKELALSLGLDENASEAEIKAAIEALKQPQADGDKSAKPEKKEETPPDEGAETKTAENAKGGRSAATNGCGGGANKPTPEGYIPLNEYKKALKENAELQVALNNQQAQTQTKTAFSIVDEAVKDGRIAPNSVDFWKTAATNLGVDYVKEQLGKMLPLVSTAANSQLEKSPTAKQSRLTDEQIKIAEVMGYDPQKMAEQMKP